MPPRRTQINCPQCKQPFLAEVQQLFDVGVEPQAKQLLLSGAFNRVSCPHCGYQGALATPIVYHDPAKELLLTYTPPELNLPMTEQERAIGNLINQAVNDLPQKQRKGYLLNPQPVLTLQGLLERILEADGITKEMIEAQQERLVLLQRMVDMTDDVLEEVAKQEDEKIDAQFFALLSQLAQVAQASGDQEQAKQLADLQDKLLPLTTFGREMQAQAKEIEAAIKTLQDAGEQLTRDKLLDIVVESAGNETRLNALVGLARPGMDYQFFQQLSDRIEAAEGQQKEELAELRERLLEMTQAIDAQMQTRADQAKRNLETLLEAEDIKATTLQNLAAIDELFIQVFQQEHAAAEQGGDEERLAKLDQVLEALREVTKPGPEAQFLQDLLAAPDEAARKQLLESRREEVTPAFLEGLTGLLVQLESGEDKETAEQVRAIYRMAVRMSMEAGMKGE